MRLLGPLRFGDLAEGLPGIGTNTLAGRLKHLEASGVVQRRLLPLAGPRDGYEHLHRLLTRQLTPAKAVATGAVTLDGDASALPSLVELFAFPTLEPTAGN